MKLPARSTLSIAAALLAAGIAQVASASLITNGTFDTDLSGWDTTGTTTGNTWDSATQTAHIGEKGTPGMAMFAQSFDIPAGTGLLDISFDYQWQVDMPASTDTFTADLTYQSTGGPVTISLVNEGSNTATFGSTVNFSTQQALSNLQSGLNNGTIKFTLNEVNSPKGTRIELDNVAVAAIPEASAVMVWSLLTLGACCLRRRAV